MGLPIVQEIFDGIRWIISEFLDKAPKPLKFLIFMLFLTGLASLIPFFMHIIGFHCNTDLDVVKTSTFKFSSNIKLAFVGEDDVINSSSYNPEPLTIIGLAVESCKRTICFHNGDAYYAIESECDNETTLYPFALDSSDYGWVRCADCELGYFNETFIRGTFGASETKNLCFGDAYATDMNWLQEQLCDPEDRCLPPENYYYEYDTGTYDCDNLDVCGLNNSVITSEVDTLLLNADGYKFYDDPDPKNYKNMAMLKCDTSLRPNLTFFGIPVFDYRLWLMIAIISTMFVFLRNIKTH